jgi:AcrR family transcriptional regulator
MATRDQATRARILEQATALFSERGFKKVTVREICRAAKANGAAVNYHFGDKSELYRRILEDAVDRMTETTRLVVAAGHDRSPEDQLRAYVHVTITRGRQSSVHALLAHEFEEPSEMFELIMREVITPRLDYLAGVVCALSGWAGEDVRVLRVISSVQWQLMMLMKPPAERAPAAWRQVFSDVDAAADHIASFTIAGIRGLAATDIWLAQPPGAMGR